MEACSITVVPEQLRESKAEAYRPKVVSMGPLPRGTNTDLLCMEETKLRCMLHLLQRSKGSEAAAIKQVLLECTKAMLDLDEVVRASYNVEKVRFNPEDLAKIMLVDGCLLLELLICASPHLDAQVPGPGPGPSPGAGIIKREMVLSDFTVLDNQIPLGILNKLSKVLFPQIRKNEDVFQKIREGALSIMGYDYTTLGSVHIGGFHFVELVHSFVHMEKHALEKKNIKSIDCKIDIDRKEYVRIHPKIRLQPCAARLEAAGVTIQSTGAEPAGVTIQFTGGVTIRSTGVEPAGVTIQSTGAEPKSTRFDLKVTFQDGKLTIPPLHITETTEAKWRKMNKEKHFSHRTQKPKMTFIHGRSYSAIGSTFGAKNKLSKNSCLICCVHDVRLLRDKGVILVPQIDTEKGNKDIMSDEDLMYLFENMTRDAPGGEIDMDS
ncbi:hypothetical protein Fmac_012224 [Flemingia macrophylla]|uniref:Uncharacterized protein n=1 Tax=Flemingia macrophylla TaxID=520843 RepID=A0ABD1MPR3_9FABA